MWRCLVFQYSLCRVVLMVMGVNERAWQAVLFQYSLCRVVLMVIVFGFCLVSKVDVSVLALSSRFDGRRVHGSATCASACFSTRSVESF